MSTLQEIKRSIASLPAADKAILTAELFAMETEPDAALIEPAMERGLRDLEAGRIRPIEDVRSLLPGRISKS